MYSMAIALDDPRYIGYTLIKGLRNAATETTRDALTLHGIPAGARNLGKIKTATESTALVADASPLGKSYPDFVHDLHKASTVLALVSGVDIVAHGVKELHNARNTLHTMGVTLPVAA